MTDIKKNYDIENLSNKIKKLRELRNETQDSLANKLNVQRQTIIEWEKPEGGSIPTTENLIKLCNVLDCSMDYLLWSIDTPEFESISRASFYSGISLEIIKYGIENPVFLDCLNYFMKPSNTASIFNSLNLNTWKQYCIDSSLNSICAYVNKEVIDKLPSYYEEYIASEPLCSISEKTYKKFLEKKFSEDSFSFDVKKTDTGINIKKSASTKYYENLFDKRKFNYSSFISFLAKHTFIPLCHKAIIEVEKQKLANMFVELFNKYIDEEYELCNKELSH